MIRLVIKMIRPAAAGCQTYKNCNLQYIYNTRTNSKLIIIYTRMQTTQFY